MGRRTGTSDRGLMKLREVSSVTWLVSERVFEPSLSWWQEPITGAPGMEGDGKEGEEGPTHGGLACSQDAELSGNQKATSVPRKPLLRTCSLLRLTSKVTTIYTHSSSPCTWHRQGPPNHSFPPLWKHTHARTLSLSHTHTLPKLLRQYNFLKSPLKNALMDLNQ